MATSLMDEQQPGRYIPWRKAKLPESVEATTRHPGEINDRCAQSSHTSNALQNRSDRRGVGCAMNVTIIWKSGTDDAIGESATTRDAHGRAVQLGAISGPGAKDLVPENIDNRASDRDVAIPECDRHADVGDCVQEVDRAVERIDDPASSRRDPP